MGVSCSCFEGIASSSVSRASELRATAVKGFTDTFGSKPTFAGIAPGRAEVLGNHTDYNEGFILACAMDRYLMIVGRSIEGSTSRISSTSFPGIVDFETSAPVRQVKDRSWANYVMGVVDELRKRDISIASFEGYVVSDIPAGAGVSSSAALEMATIKFLGGLNPKTVGALDQLEMVKVSKAAENNFVGMPCGILDQFSSGFGQDGYLLSLDCRTLDHSVVPFRGTEWVLSNTNSPHALVDGQYATLRQNCFEAADRLKELTGNDKITHLRDVDSKVLLANKDNLTERQFGCASHIVFENERVEQGIEALKKGDMATFGKYLCDSQKSSQYDFGNSSPELDIMAEAAKGIDGFYGCRLMGGGFGGSTINAVEEGKSSEFCKELKRRYKEKTGIDATTIVCKPGRGAWGEKL